MLQFLCQHTGRVCVLHFLSMAVLAVVVVPSLAVLVYLAWRTKRDSNARVAASDERYRLLAENASDVIFTMDLDLRYTYVSPSATKLRGFTVDEVMRQTPADVLTPSSYEQVMRAVKEELTPERLAPGAEFWERSMDVEMVRKDGSTVWTEVNMTLLRDSSGAAVGLLGVTRDISERRKAAEETRTVQAFLDAIIDNLPIAVFVKDASHRIMLWNKAAEQLFGYPREAVIGKTDQDLYPKEQADFFWKKDDEAIKGSGLVDIIEEPIDTSQGRRLLHTRKVPILGANGVSPQLLGISEDITEWKRVEANLRMQTSAINAAWDQIIITGVDDTIEFVNPAFERETGYSAEEVVGRNHSTFRLDDLDEARRCAMVDQIHSGRAWRGEVPARRKDGTTATEDLTITPVTNDAGEILHFVAIKRNITDKKAYEKQLDYLAYHDHLTGLPNRLRLSDTLTRKLDSARRAGNLVAVLFIDLDRFKNINDTLGHNVGDRLLKAVSKRLGGLLRDGDTLARMGGDEFIIIVEDAEVISDVEAIARRVLNAFSDPFVLEGRELFISASIGISAFPLHGTDVETLVRNADAAMYRAKDQQRNNFHIYTDALSADALERMTLENSLRKALDRDEFAVCYQPRVDVTTGQILGTEALIRWRHAEMGLIPPSQFIPLAEESGMIVPISEWVLRQACMQNKAWQDQGFAPMDVAVNISARQFHQEDLADTVTRVLRETGLAPRWLNLELTESALMSNPDSATDTLRKLKDMGVGISIDDFGTGYSSLSYLKRFPIDSVKIDRSFVRDITTNPDDAAIAGAVVAMAHSLKMRVVAEGVESFAQLEFLRSLHCDEMQGYLILRPVPANQIEDYMAEWFQTGTALPAA